jgi:hypothetical protein
MPGCSVREFYDLDRVAGMATARIARFSPAFDGASGCQRLWVAFLLNIRNRRSPDVVEVDAMHGSGSRQICRDALPDGAELPAQISAAEPAFGDASAVSAPEPRR